MTEGKTSQVAIHWKFDTGVPAFLAEHIHPDRDEIWDYPNCSVEVICWREWIDATCIEKPGSWDDAFTRLVNRLGGAAALEAFAERKKPNDRELVLRIELSGEALGSMSETGFHSRYMTISLSPHTLAQARALELELSFHVPRHR